MREGLTTVGATRAGAFNWHGDGVECEMGGGEES